MRLNCSQKVNKTSSCSIVRHNVMIMATTMIDNTIQWAVSSEHWATWFWKLKRWPKLDFVFAFLLRMRICMRVASAVFFPYISPIRHVRIMLVCFRLVCICTKCNMRWLGVCCEWNVNLNMHTWIFYVRAAQTLTSSFQSVIHLLCVVLFFNEN